MCPNWLLGYRSINDHWLRTFGLKRHREKKTEKHKLSHRWINFMMPCVRLCACGAFVLFSRWLIVWLGVSVFHSPSQHYANIYQNCLKSLSLFNTARWLFNEAIVNSYLSIFPASSFECCLPGGAWRNKRYKYVRQLVMFFKWLYFNDEMLDELSYLQFLDIFTI